MNKIDCQDYSIYFNDFNRLNQLVAEGHYSKVFVLVDEHTEKDCLPIFQNLFITDFQSIKIQSGEINKNLDTCNLIWQHLMDGGADRYALLINLGGGVIGDMGGFVASTYMRGIDFVQLPTTLLAMVDASIGGKLGIDFLGFKNMIGLFNNPKAIFIHEHFLKTLPQRELSSGYAEVIKHRLINDKAAFYQFKMVPPSANENINQIIHHAILIKKNVVENDPYEKGERKILNFGHTVGHGIESIFLDTSTPLLHGEAIAAGMIIESHISWQKELLTQQELQDITEAILHIFPKKENMPTEIIAKMQKDKKNKGGSIKGVALQGIGSAIYDVDYLQDEISAGIRFYNSLKLFNTKF